MSPVDTERLDHSVVMLADSNSDWLITAIALGVFFLLLALYLTCNSRKCHSRCRWRANNYQETRICCRFLASVRCSAAPGLQGQRRVGFLDKQATLASRVTTTQRPVRYNQPAAPRDRQVCTDGTSYSNWAFEPRSMSSSPWH